MHAFKNDTLSMILPIFKLFGSHCLFLFLQATDEVELKAHRVILSACSPQLRDLLKRHSTSQNLILYLRGVRQSDLEVAL